MPSLVGAVVTCGVALTLVAGVPAAQSQGQTPAAPVAGSTESPRPEQFAGSWSYNAEESVNAYTGKPETVQTRTGTNPRSGSGSGGSGSKPQPSGGSGSNPGGTGNPGGYPGPAGTGAGTQGPPPIGNSMPGLGGAGSMTNAPPSIDPGVWRGGWAVQWARSAQRDLLEVPWGLTIDVTPEAVTFVDDLDRSRTYLTNAKRQKYQLGAAIYNAKTYWDGPRLKKDIDAAGQFKMQETYFLSEDASRLFVIVRVGDPKQAASKNVPLAGVNRVYDRAQR